MTRAAKGAADDGGASWVVESLGESTADVEVGEAVVKLPRWLLPEDAAEGDVLVVEHSRSGDRVTLTVRRDADATKAALAESEKQIAEAPLDTKGGDVTL